MFTDDDNSFLRASKTDTNDQRCTNIPYFALGERGLVELLCCRDDEKIVVGAGASTINWLQRHKKNSDVEQKEKRDAIEAGMRPCPALRSPPC